MLKTFVAIVLIIGAFCSQLLAISPQEIIAPDSGYVKNIELPGDELNSLAIDMKMRLPLPMLLLVQLRYSAPDKYSLNVFEGEAHTPVMIVRGEKAMINDPLQNQISLIASAGVAFDLSPQAEQYNANFAFNMPLEGKINNRVKLDFLTLFSRLETELKAIATASGLIELSGTTAQNSSCRAVFSASAAMPLQSLEIMVENNPEPVLQFDKIAADLEIASSSFIFPLNELKEKQVEFVEIKRDGMLDTMMVVASVMKAIFTRAAIANAPFRSEIEKQLQIKPDWEKIQQQDQQRSQKLQQIFRPFY